MNDSWTCLMVGKNMSVISDAVRSALQFAAFEMSARKNDRAQIRSDVCSGYVQTEGKTCLVGTRSGVLFNAFIEHAGGETPVNFLLGRDDLERGAAALREQIEKNGYRWVDGDPSFEIPPELYEFKDLRPKSLN